MKIWPGPGPDMISGATLVANGPRLTEIVALVHSVAWYFDVSTITSE